MAQIVPTIFHSGGVPLAGRFYRDTADPGVKQPTVVVTGSWLTVKEQMAAVYAERLAALGYTAFTFDFSGFGESAGTPRQAEMPARKIADISAAIDFVSTHAFVRDGAVGHLAVCASAQYALAAIARGARTRALVGVAGWFHDAATIAPFYGGPDGVARRIAQAARAVEAFNATGKVEVVPAYEPGNELAGMDFELDYYAKATRGAVPAWRNEMATLSWLYWLTFDGMRAAAAVEVPTLLVHGDGCVLPDNAKRVYERLRGRKELVWTEGNQVDFYDQPSLVDTAVSAAHRHFQEALAT